MPRQKKPPASKNSSHWSLAKTLKKHRPQIYLGLLVAYVVLLALGTVSEVFHLGWFRWLGP